MTFFYRSPARITECVSEYIFLIKKKSKKQRQQGKKQKKLKNKREYLWKIQRDTIISFAISLCVL